MDISTVIIIIEKLQQNLVESFGMKLELCPSLTCILEGWLFHSLVDSFDTTSRYNMDIGSEKTNDDKQSK